jgi:hypothetical protein
MGWLNNSVAQPGVTELGNLFLSVTGGKVFYVGTAAMIANYSDVGQGIAGRLFTDVNTALGQCVAGRGDTIYILPGYTENISASDAWSGLGVATDVTIIGMGRGTNRPTFTWTANGATVLFDTANFRVLNVRMFMAGPQQAGAAQTTAAPITVSAAGCEISGCEIWWGFDADQIVTIGITTTAAADNFTFNSNFCYAETAAVPTTTFLRLTGTDNLRMDGTVIIGPGSTTAIGPVQQLTTASLKVWIHDCVFQSTLAASTIAFTAIAGCTGTVDKCSFGVLAAGNGLTAASGMQVTNSKTAVAAAAGADTTG